MENNIPALKMKIENNNFRKEQTRQEIDSLKTAIAEAPENSASIQVHKDAIVNKEKAIEDLITKNVAIQSEIAELSMEMKLNEQKEKLQKELQKEKQGKKEDTLNLKEKTISKRQKSYSYNIKGEDGKVVKKTVTFDKVEKDFTPLDHTVAFLKSFQNPQSQLNYEKMINEKNAVQKTVNILTVNDTATGSATFLNGPGYELGSGETQTTISSVPALLTSIIADKVYSSSALALLANGFTYSKVWNGVQKIVQLDGGDFTAEAGVKNLFDLEEETIKTKWHKITGMLIYTEEDLMGSDVLNFVLGRFTQLAAAAISKQMDYLLINNESPKGFPGLASAERKKAGTEFKPASIVEYTDIEDLLLQIEDTDPDYDNGNVNVVLDKEIFTSIKGWYRKGDKKNYDVTFTGNSMNVSGQVVNSRKSMFSNKYANRIVGVVTEGQGLSAYVYGSGIQVKSDGGLSDFDRNIYKILAEIFVDVVVNSSEKVRVILDNKSFFGAPKSAATSNAVTFAVADGNGTAVADGKKYKLVLEENGRPTVSAALVPSASGDVAFTGVDAAAAGKVVLLIDENGKVVGRTRMAV